mmetsp:Transcript_153704/g.294547  ORF Transcript_153704/g.294547 Transcript_153704/m.294547 type:complete len:223 (-) Transcript_153704:17-685(-)
MPVSRSSRTECSDLADFFNLTSKSHSSSEGCAQEAKRAEPFRNDAGRIALRVSCVAQLAMAAAQLIHPDAEHQHLYEVALDCILPWIGLKAAEQKETKCFDNLSVISLASAIHMFQIVKSDPLHCSPLGFLAHKMLGGSVRGMVQVAMEAPCSQGVPLFTYALGGGAAWLVRRRLPAAAPQEEEEEDEDEAHHAEHDSHEADSEEVTNNTTAGELLEGTIRA